MLWKLFRHPKPSSPSPSSSQLEVSAGLDGFFSLEEVGSDLDMMEVLADTWGVAYNRPDTEINSLKSQTHSWRLGEILLHQQLISATQLAEAIALQRSTRKRLGELLVERAWITPHQLSQALSEQQRWNDQCHSY